MIWIRLKRSRFNLIQIWIPSVDLSPLYVHFCNALMKKLRFSFNAASCTPFECDMPTLALYLPRTAKIMLRWFLEKCDSRDLWQFTVNTSPQVLATQRLVIRTRAVCKLRTAICHKGKSNWNLSYSKIRRI
jgi:hypothetical protein